MRFTRLPPLSQVPRVLDPADDVIREYFVAEGAPVVIVGNPSLAKGPKTVEELAARGAEIEVNVRSGNYTDVSNRKNDKMSLADYLLQCAAPPADPGDRPENELPLYSGNTPLSQRDFDTLGLSAPPSLQPRRMEVRIAEEVPRLWVGPAGSLTPLHYDSRDNMVCQYIGRKHFVLYPPSQIKWLYTYGVAPSWSRVPNPKAPDLVKYPLFAKARCVEVTLHAGEILYLPARWAHFVVNLDVSMMVNFWPGYSLGLFGKKALSAISRRVKQRVGVSS